MVSSIKKEIILTNSHIKRNEGAKIFETKNL